jgi:protein phosphatase
MVCDHVQPLEFVARGRRGLTQPAVKCGEYLRIIYGPEYTAEQNLTRLGARAPGANRSLALREFALGVEALDRFARREPLRRVHECVFGVPAPESGRWTPDCERPGRGCAIGGRDILPP